MENICTKRQSLKSFSAFNKNIRRNDGLQAYCRESKNETELEWKQNNKSHVGFNLKRYPIERRANDVIFKLARNLELIMKSFTKAISK